MYEGVLGQEYTVKDQEKRLTMELTKLKNDAASVTGFSVDRSYMTFIVLWAINWFASTKALALTKASCP